MHVNRSDLIDQLVEKYNYTKKAATSLVDDFTAVITDNLVEGNHVNIYNFGRFEPAWKKPTKIKNVYTGDIQEIGAKVTPRFYPSLSLKQRVKDNLEGAEERME